MFSPSKFLNQLLLGIGFTILINSLTFAKLSLEEINSVARQTTVLIASGLTNAVDPNLSSSFFCYPDFKI